jgi:DNA-binding SARP family transcriptional activator
VHPVNGRSGTLIDATTAREPEALLSGAATLSRTGNRVAAVAALISAVGVAPDDLTAHRRLAGAYAVTGHRDSARAEYDRFIARLEARGALDAAAVEQSYAAVLFPPPSSARIATTGPGHGLTAEQSVALRRVGVALVAIAATLVAMFAAGAQIFASGGPL